MAEHSVPRTELQDAGVVLHEHVGTARFVDPHTIEAEHGIRLSADKFILCAGGTNRALPVPGAELVGSHRDAWTLTTVPESLLVIGAGATGVQVASVFAELGSRVMLFEAGPRILATEDEDVSRTMAASFRAAGIEVREDFGRIRGFEKAPAGVRMVFAKDDAVDSVEATLAVAAIGWLADTAGLNLAAAGVATTDRGYVQVDEHLRTTAPHVFAAGDITGRLMLVPHAVQDGYLAATNAVQDRGATLSPPAIPDRQLHRPRIRAGRSHRGPGPPRPRRGGGHGAVRGGGAADHRRAPRRVLQAHRRPRHAPRSSAATSSASGRSRSPRWPPSPSPPRCRWSSSSGSRFPSPPTPTSWDGPRSMPPANSTCPASGTPRSRPHTGPNSPPTR